MRTLLMVVCLPIVLAAPSSPVWAQDSALERLELLKRSLAKHPVWQASYHQVNTPAGMVVLFAWEMHE